MPSQMRSHKSIHQQKVIIGLLVGGVVVVIFLAVFGLPILVNLGIWFNATFGEQATEVQQEEDFFGTIYVNPPPPATNSASLAVSGNTTNFETVSIILNDQTVAEIDVMDQDAFEQTIEGLIPGENSIQVIAQANGQEKGSDPFVVRYLNTKPEMTIESPADGDTTTQDSLTIRGSTDPEHAIEIDGAPVIVTAAGSFEEEVRLSEGENTIEVVVIDDAGNQTTQELTLTREKDE